MKIKLVFLLPLIFFIVGVFTLPDYGINWDTINHLPRGQAYLHYFLTGNKDYKDLAPFRPYFQNPDSLKIDTNLPKEDIPQRSFYETDGSPFYWYMDEDGAGHPPLSDILSALFNYILFSKLHLINDVDSYHVYGIFLAAALVGLVYYWSSKVYGRFAGVVGALSLSLYPLFWSEAHFNTEKDIPETVYFSFVLFALWKGLTSKSIKWILASGVFFGLAFGTKLNIIFSFLIFFPWMFLYFFIAYLRNRKHLIVTLKSNLKLIFALILSPILGIAIFLATWPYLWQTQLYGLRRFLGFYKSIGLTTNIDSTYLGPFKTNIYPIKWIIFTTPETVLFLTALGILALSLHLRREVNKTSLLFLLWLIVPIARITWPGTTVYGGIRQIMEYIPALAIIAGAGGQLLRDFLTNNLLKILRKNFYYISIISTILIIILFIPLLWKLIQIHPNENVYFNNLIGGLRGAKAKNIPSWGNTFGAAYRQGVKWIDQNAEYGSGVVFAYELIPNVPAILFRPDLVVHNSLRSGYLMKGEYAITLVYQGTENRSYYDMYLDKFIKPVYESSVDGVAILKVWKNSRENLIQDVKEEELASFEITQKPWGIDIDLQKNYNLSRVELSYSQEKCLPLSSGSVEISEDSKKWFNLPGTLPDDWRISNLGEQPKNGYFIEPFVGQKARFIRIHLSPKETCLLKGLENSKVIIFSNLSS